MHTVALLIGAFVFGQMPESLDPPNAAPEAFAHIRIDAAARTVELDATVPIRLDDPRAPRVYLEQLVCIPDTKEHEVVLVTRAKPSHVHAALLAIGLTPGKPATWKQQGTQMVPIAPEGDAVRIELVYSNAAGERVTDRPSSWVKNAVTGAPWPEGDWVFAGSVMTARAGREVYEADAGGTLIGLTSFGTEVLAWPKVISPDSQQQEPEWIADAAHVPPMGTPVVVRLSIPKR
ncbi:MAG: hypothetical protein JNK58_02355 [Phycisphaerae bacterium]|nr:hypothetical protein [Phycisphaerae bacterium]